MSDKGGVYVTGQGKDAKIKNLFDAISEIEYAASSEEESEKISGKFFTTKHWVAFTEVGAKASLVSGLFSALLSPLMMGVFEKIVPVFGSYNPTIIDEIYVTLLAVSFSLGYAVFISKIGKYWSRSYSLTKKMVQGLMLGLTIGMIIKAGIVFMLFHYIYIQLTPDRISYIASYIGRMHLEQTLNITVDEAKVFITKFREVFIPAAYFVLFTSFLFIAIPWWRVFRAWLIDWLYEDEEFERN